MTDGRRPSPLRPRLLRQVLIAVLVASFLSVAVASALTYRSTSQAIRSLEQRQARENLENSLRLLEERGDQQLALIASWSVDARTEAAARRRDTPWFLTHAAHKLMGVGGVTALKVYDRDGLMMGSAGEMLASGDLWNSRPARAARRGVSAVALVSNIGGMWIVAAAPILGEDLAPPSRGVLIGASRVDSRTMHALAGGGGDGFAMVLTSRVVASSGSAIATAAEAALRGSDETPAGVIRSVGLDLSFAPLHDDGSSFFAGGADASFVVATSRAAFDQARDDLLRDTVAALLAALAIAVLAATLLSRRLVRPLRTLLRDVKATGEGDLGRTTEVYGDDEIADLARAFNRMTRGLAAAHESLRNAASRDSATGLLNHGEFFRRLSGELARADREDRPVAMLMIDVDDFKRINDQYGHLAGDAVLLRVANIVTEHARESDVIARYGGDEFAVVMLGVEAAEAVGIADRLRGLAAASGDSLDATRVPCRLSIGVAVRRPWGASAAQFVEAADHALLTAKRRGRDRVVLEPSSAPRYAHPGGAPA